MSKPTRKALLWLMNVSLTIVGAWFLNEAVALLPFDMPYAVDVFLRGMLRLVGHTELANPDDMEVLAAGLYFVLSLVVVGVLVWLGNRLVRGYVARRSGAGSRG